MLGVVQVVESELQGSTHCPVAESIAELWHRAQVIPNRSHDPYLLASPLTPPERLTTSAGAFDNRSHVIPGRIYRAPSLD